MKWVATAAAVILCLLAMHGSAEAATAEYQVAASVDDTSTYSLSSSVTGDNAFFPYDRDAPNNRPAFFRWALDIPEGATVTSAYLKVSSYATLTPASTVRLQLVDLDSCPALNSPNPYGYAVTAGYVDWVLPADWTIDTWYTSPDIKTIVQEFVNRDGYAPGNYLGLRSDRAGGGYRRIRQWDYGDHTWGAKLVVTYEGGIYPPSADAGSDQTVRDDDYDGSQTVLLDGSGSTDDGQIVSYVWSEGAAQLATGRTAEAALGIGTHTITLTVTDDEAATGQDTLTVIVYCDEYYVDATNGSDGNPGTATLPWQTFARIQAGPLYPGTTVYCTGDLGTVNIEGDAPCGTAEAPITYARWPGHPMPHIDSLTFDASPVKDAHLVFQEFNFDPGYMASCLNPPPAVSVAGANYVTFDTCQFEGAKLAGDPPGDFAPYGIKESQLSVTFTSGDMGGASYISILHCTFDHSAYALRISENLAVPDREADHWEVLGCDFRSGAEDAILTTGNADLVVAGCRFHDQNYLASAFSWPGTAYGTWPPDYTWGACTQDNTGASAIFYHLESDRIYLLPDDEDHPPRRSLTDTWRLDSDPTNVYFVPSAEGDSPHTDCIAVQGTTDGLLIENNRFECMAYSGQQIKLDPLGVPGNPKNVVIQNNLFVAMTDDPAYLLCVGGGSNVVVRHNTIDAGPVHPLRGVRYYTTAPPIDVLVHNNILSGAVWQSGVPDSDYNCWMTPPVAEINEGPHSFVVSRAAVGFADVAHGDYHLTGGSPCIDKGNPDQAPGVCAEHPEGIDYDGNNRDALPDLGAYECRQSAPEITAWHVPAGHGGSDVAVPMTDGSVEPRLAGIAGVHIVFSGTLAEATVTTGAVTITGDASGDLSSRISGVSLLGGNTIVVTLSSALPDAERFTLAVAPTVTDGAGQPVVGDLDIRVAALAGDVDGSGVVTAADVLASRTHGGSAVTADTARYDVDGSGTITAADMRAVRPLLGRRLP
ncbi:MAG TPA: dockerin type I domain-containing protein [Phycisphaerae bacterium]|nr:dockerin type I domain-containing protein [Phycisphaerae bacterium]